MSDPAPHDLERPASVPPAGTPTRPAASDDRVAAVVAMVPDEARAIVEVGYDRGFVLAALAARFRDRRPPTALIGVEIQPAAPTRVPAPLAAAVELRVGDGLAPIAPGEVDGAVIAGLGGRTIVGVLERAAATTASLRWLVLCPSHFEDELRPGLARLGWHPAEERLVCDRGRFYEVMLALPGPDASAPDPLIARWGPRLTAGPDPLFAAWLADLRHRYRRAIAGALDRTSIGRKLGELDAIEARVLGPRR